MQPIIEKIYNVEDGKLKVTISKREEIDEFYSIGEIKQSIENLNYQKGVITERYNESIAEKDSEIQHYEDMLAEATKAGLTEIVIDPEIIEEPLEATDNQPE